MDLDTLEWLELSVGLAAARAVNDINQATSMDILKTLENIKSLKGSVERTMENVDAKIGAVVEREQKIKVLADKAVAPAIRDLDTMAAHLTEVANALEGNGGPPLDGENQSTPSDGQSVENPTNPQS